MTPSRRGRTPRKRVGASLPAGPIPETAVCQAAGAEAAAAAHHSPERASVSLTEGRGRWQAGRTKVDADKRQGSIPVTSAGVTPATGSSSLTARRRVSQDEESGGQGSRAVTGGGSPAGGSARRRRPQGDHLESNRLQRSRQGTSDRKRSRANSETPPLERKRRRSIATEASQGERSSNGRSGSKGKGTSGLRAASSSPLQVVTRRRSKSPGLASPPLLSPRASERAARSRESGRKGSPGQNGGSVGRGKPVSPGSSRSRDGSGGDGGASDGSKRVSNRPAGGAGANQRGSEGSGERDRREGRRAAVLFSRSLDESLTAKLTKVRRWGKDGTVAWERQTGRSRLK